MGPGWRHLGKVFVCLAEKIQIPPLVQVLNGAVSGAQMVFKCPDAMGAEAAVVKGGNLVVDLPADHIGMGSEFLRHFLRDPHTIVKIVRVVGAAMPPTAVLVALVGIVDEPHFRK